MSNKKWRTPASAEPEPTPTETSSPQAPEPSRSGPVPLTRYPDDYVSNGPHGDHSPKPGCYRTQKGLGRGAVDMRSQCGALGNSEPMTDVEAAAIARDAVRFLWQVMAITSRLAESIQLGDIRKLVAHDLAMPGGAVQQDGTVSAHADAFEVSEGETEAEARARTAPTQQQTAARKPRGSTHPFLVLLRLAVQAARLIKQITTGTHPKAYNKLDMETAEHRRALEDTEAWAASVLKGS